MNAPHRILAHEPAAPPFTADYIQCILDRVAREQASPRWSWSARQDLVEIKFAALAVLDHLDGQEGFDDAPAKLERRLSDWSEDCHYATFPAMFVPAGGHHDY